MGEQLVGVVVAHQDDDTRNTMTDKTIFCGYNGYPITVRGEGAKTMLTIIGVQRKTGEFQGREYDNIMIHCSEDNPSTPTICGNVCETLKVKTSSIREAFDGLVTCDSDWRELVGQKIRPYFDRYGKVIRCELVSDKF